jgi:hypothetical protein
MESIVGTTSELIRSRARLGRVVTLLTLLVVAATIGIAFAVVSHSGRTAPVGSSTVWGIDRQALIDAGFTGRMGASTQTIGLEEQLVNAGLVPAETLQPAQVTGRSLYSARDRALMAAVAAGLVPEEAVQSEHFLILRLVNQGLIPRETVAP